MGEKQKGSLHPPAVIAKESSRMEPPGPRFKQDSEGHGYRKLSGRKPACHAMRGAVGSPAKPGPERILGDPVGTGRVDLWAGWVKGHEDKCPRRSLSSSPDLGQDNEYAEQNENTPNNNTVAIELETG